LPRTKEQNEIIRKERIQQIIRATWEIYLERGIRNIDVKDVAEKAGLGKGTIYHYFPTKTDLLQSLLYFALQNRGNKIDELLNSIECPLERIKKITEVQLKSLIKVPNLYKFFKNFYDDAEFVFGDNKDDIIKDFKNTYSGVTASFQEAMDKGLIIKMDVTRLTDLFWGAMIGSVTLYIDHKSLMESDILVDQIIKLLFSGIELHKNR